MKFLVREVEMMRGGRRMLMTVWRRRKIPDRFCAILDYVKSETNCSVAANLTDSHENRHRVYSDQYAQKSLDGFFNFDFVCELQPIEISGEGADFDVSPYLRNALAKQNQIAWRSVY